MSRNPFARILKEFKHRVFKNKKKYTRKVKHGKKTSIRG